MGAIFAGTLLSNWIGGIPRQISDILRIIVLDCSLSNCSTVYQHNDS